MILQTTLQFGCGTHLKKIKNIYKKKSFQGGHFSFLISCQSAEASHISVDVLTEGLDGLKRKVMEIYAEKNGFIMRCVWQNF